MHRAGPRSRFWKGRMKTPVGEGRKQQNKIVADLVPQGLESYSEHFFKSVSLIGIWVKFGLCHTTLLTFYIMSHY